VKPAPRRGAVRGNRRAARGRPSSRARRVCRGSRLAGEPREDAKKRAWRAWAVAAALGGFLAAAGAHGAKPPRVHALVGARIVVAPGKVIESGTVVLRDGVITAVGAKVEAPADARIWDLKGKTIYPGLVEAYSVRPWPQPSQGRDEKKPEDVLANAQLHPERDMTAWAADDAAAKKLRDAGFGAALVAPKDGILRGRSVVVELGDRPEEQSLLRQGVAQHAQLKAAGRGEVGGSYPVSLMGAIALFRQTLMDAGWYGRAQAAYAKNPAQERPAVQPALATLQGVAAGNDLIVFETEDVLDTLRVAKVVRELKLKAMVVGNGEEYKRLASVRQTGLAHILPLAFPKAPKIEGAGGDDTTDLEALRHWDAAPDNPRLLLSTGLTVAFSSYKLDDPRKLYENLAVAMKRGLTAEQALAALTTTPAQLLGLSGRLGTVEAGKIANLVVVDGDLFVAKPKLREVWVDGSRYEVKEAKAAGAEVEPAGTWDLTIKTGDGQEISSTLEIAGRAGKLTGSVSAMGRKATLSSAEVSGNLLEVEFDGASFGMSGAFSFSLEISGDSASGSGTSPQGSFTLDATRSAKPAGPASPPSLHSLAVSAGAAALEVTP
jgi:imidazolonepropionase-like amidohydrolase